ncbi:MAG: hypothetical protein ACTSV1_05715 [Alphaproteobacteria bacterium]
MQEAFGEAACFKIGVLGDSHNTYQDFLAAAGQDTFTLYGGHFCFGIDRHIRRASDYVVSLRHPVERLLSRYEAVCLIQDTKLNWRDWLENDFESNNGIIKRLLGVAHQEDESVVFDINADAGQSGAMAVGEEHLNAALDILDNRVSCVLFKEHFEESLLRLGTLFGMPPLFSMRRQFINHGRVPIREQDYPQEIVDEIRARNTYDIRLYEKCLGDFETFLSMQDATFHEEVRIMKILSKMLKDRDSQILGEDALMGRFFDTINEMLKTDQVDDAIAVIHRFTCSPFMSMPFYRGVLKLLDAIDAKEALRTETDKYEKRFGGDAFVDAFKPAQEQS